MSKEIEHVQFVSTCRKDEKIVRHVAKNGNMSNGNIRHVEATFDMSKQRSTCCFDMSNSTCCFDMLLVWTGLKASVYKWLVMYVLFLDLAMDRTGWRSTCKTAVEEFEVRRIQELEANRDLRKSGPPSTSNFECQICHRMCRSRIGLLVHNTSHL